MGYARLEEKAVQRRIAVVGCGHVGVVTAAGLAALGHQVVGVDINADRIAELAGGRVPFAEPGLTELVQAGLGSGALTFVTGYEAALAGAEVVVLCVNTPTSATGAADLREVRQAVLTIGATLVRTGDRPVIVNKSTSPVGTGELIDTLLAGTAPAPEQRLPVAVNPEFLREGSAVADFFRPDRIVVGAEREEVARAVAALYDGIDAPVVLTDLRTAEMTKYVANSFLATRVSFINEVARLCEALGIDVEAVLQGVTLDPRIGRAFFRPGIGYGGGCLPKDVAALCHTGESVGLTMRILTAVQETNLSQRTHAVTSIRRMLGSLEGQTLAVWGVTFKGGTEDRRESPAIAVIELLRNEGAVVRVYDPTLPAGRPVPFADEVCADPLAAALGASAVAVLADWPEFMQVDLAQLRQIMTGRLVYDGRNQLSREAVQAAGLLYHGVGRSPVGDARLWA